MPVLQPLSDQAGCCLDDVPAMAAVGSEHGAACLRWRDTSEVLAEVVPE